MLNSSLLNSSGSNRLFPTNKNNPCRISGDISGKCRTKNNEEQAVLCGCTPTAKEGDREGPYICTNDNGKGHTTHTWVLAKEDFNQWDDDRKTQYLLEKQRRTLIAERERQAKIAAESPIDERDRFNRQIIAQLPLKEADRQHLLDRGFTPEQIEECQFKSVNQWQRVELAGCPANFPGLVNPGFGNTDIRKMVISGDGILCPIIQDGKMVAFKVRLTDGKDGQRYTSVSCASTSFHIGGEQPLAVLNPPSINFDFSVDFDSSNWVMNLFILLNQVLYFSTPDKRGIWVTEGSEIKPVLVNQKYDVPVLGGGRYWHRSPNHAEKYLPLFRERYGNKITLCPDAGDILNPQIYPHWLNEAEFFKSQGFEVYFAWWNQIFKHNFDIDELEDTSDIKYLSIGEFKTLVDEYNNEGFKKWRESRKFTPDITINSPDFYFPELPENNAIISVKSAMGSKKTGAILEQIKSSPNRAFLFGSRNNLLIQTAARGEEIGVKIYHLINDDASNLIPDKDTHICCCIDSIHRLDGNWENSDIYLDEISSIINHILNGGTLGENQAKAMAIFEKAIRECNRVFLLDANNNDIITDFISSIDPSKKVVKILNTAKPQQHQFKIVDGYDPEKDKRKTRDRSPIIEFMCDEEVKPFIFSDSRELTNVYAKILNENNKRGFALNRDTSSNDESLEFLENPDAYLDRHQPNFQIMSPSGSPGVSITNAKYFTHKLSVFTGVLSTDEQTQALMRLRPPLEHFIICPEFSTIRDIPKVGDFRDKSLQEITLDKIKLSASLSNSGDDMAQIVAKAIVEKAEDKWFKLSHKLGELESYERDNLRKCLMFALREQGHKVDVIQIDINQEFTQLEKEIKHELRLERATEVHKAIPFDSLEEAKQKAKTSPKPEVMRRIEKTRLLDRLPGIDLTEVFTPEFVKEVLYDDKELISNLQRYYFLQNFEISKKRSEVNWYYQATNQYFYLGSMAKDSHLKIWALQQLDIKNILNKLLDGEEIHKDHHLVTEFYQKAISSYQILLGLNTNIPRATLGGKERTDLLKSCFKSIGIKLKKTGRKLCSDNIRRNCYALDIEYHVSPERIAILDAINRKYENYLESESVKKINWESHSKPKIEEIYTDLELEKIYTRVLATRELIKCNVDWGTFQQHFAEMDEKLKKRVFEQLSFEERRILKSLKPADDEERMAKELITIIKSGKDIQVRCHLALQGVENRENLVYYLHPNYHYLLFPESQDFVA